ncbi:MAG: hypothetical protein QXM31_00580 [Candidatus Woesearchaeota archaeon]
MKAAALLLIIFLVVMPAAFAKARGYDIYQQQFVIRRTPSNATPAVQNLTWQNRMHYAGLTGIFGVNVVPYQKYEQRPFGKPFTKSEPAVRYPPGFAGAGGTANATPGVSKAPCADFGCKASQYVVGDTSTKKYYRCWCESAKKILRENIKCIDTPGVATRMGFSEGIC